MVFGLQPTCFAMRGTPELSRRIGARVAGEAVVHGSGGRNLIRERVFAVISAFYFLKNRGVRSWVERAIACFQVV